MRKPALIVSVLVLLALIGTLAFWDRPAAARGLTARAQEPSLPASGAEANQRLAASPRRGEWAVIRVGGDSVRAWVVYPARRQNASVVLAIHDNQGLSNWIRGVADQLAADGFIGIAPDLLSMQNVPRNPDGESVREGVSAALGNVDQATRDRFIQAVGEWGTKLEGASSKYGIVGFCWGGSTVFAHAVAAPAALGAVVVPRRLTAGPAGQRARAHPGPVRGRRRAGEHHRAARRLRAQGARSHVRAAHFPGRRPRIHALAGRPGRC
jgi:carboxymethylenebutenolidase